MVKKSLFCLLFLLTTTRLWPQNTSEPKYGWLPGSGISYAEFSHRIANVQFIDPLLDRIYRGRFVFHLEKQIYRSENFMAVLNLEPLLLFGGFHERRILIPAFSFRGEILFSWLINDSGLWLNLSNLHYSTHTVDNIPIDTPEEAIAAKDINLTIDDVNLIRVGLSWQSNLDSWLADKFSLEGGLQPWRLNYWLITEAQRMFNKTSYEPYTHRFYFGLSLSKELNKNNGFTLKYTGETEKILRSYVELIYYWRNQSLEESINIFLRYEGAHIGANEVLLTSHGGITRRWLLMGLRVFF